MSAGKALDPASPMGEKMLELSARGRGIIARLNREAVSDEEIHGFIAELTGREVPESFRLFLPFTADFGRNITIGEDVFINSGCRFQDQGGITIGDGALIGHNVIITTLNHDLDPERRAIMHPQSVHLGARVWIGAGAIILPGVSIGEGAVVGAGSVVTRDVAPATVVVGSPAKMIRTITTEKEGK
ncbi:DapH/DapD/GlmU-related protein [Corynebacterium sp. A21]|uniref:DapH/DapD/GlmU-related protein n=1 Tax=Corynebacterium sp. A21 TaxID=3457318 RepID=UPI003FD438B2